MTTLREKFGPILLSPAGFHSSLVETQRAWNRYDKIELEAEIARANRFLQLVGKRKSINKQFTSYALKHVVEHWTYSLPDHSGNAYVSEGCFLMAAQRLGFK